MKRIELRNAVLERADDTEGAIVKPFTVDAWLNLAVRNIWKAWPWQFAQAETTVALPLGSGSVALPADFQQVFQVYNSNDSYYLKPRAARRLRQEYGTESGAPFYYADGGMTQADLTQPPVRNLLIRPKASAAKTLVVTYKRTPATMTQDEHYSPLPEDFDNALILWCLVQFYRKLDDLAQADATQFAFEQELTNLIGQAQAFQLEAYPVIENTDPD